MPPEFRLRWMVGTVLGLLVFACVGWLAVVAS